MAFWAPVGGDPDARGHAPRTTSVKRGDTQVERTWWCVMTEAWRVAGESREKQSRFVFEIFKQGKRPCASKDAKLYENTLHYEWVFIVSFEFDFHVGERDPAAGGLILLQRCRGNEGLSYDALPGNPTECV